MIRSASGGLELDVVAEPAAPRAARRAFAAHFGNQRRLDDVLLCLNEVLTNAILHARPPIRVQAGIVDGMIRVEISDGSTASPVRRVVEQFAPTGRGLHLLDKLTSNWDVEIHADGKTVWFEIPGDQ